jgi:sigma-E factor negative regulatory protein RseA
MVMDRISAFMDGESAEHESRDVLRGLHEHPEWRESWATFHLIGDVMRGDRTLQADFVARFSGQLDREPTVLAPRLQRRRAAAYALAAAASVAAVALVAALNVENPFKSPEKTAVMARQEAGPVATGTIRLPGEGTVLRVDSERMNSYLMAHQEFSPNTALEGVAAYVRTVAAANDDTAR